MLQWGSREMEGWNVPVADIECSQIELKNLYVSVTVNPD